MAIHRVQISIQNLLLLAKHSNPCKELLKTLVVVLLIMLVAFVHISYASCNFNGICEPGEDADNCVFDCMISPLKKDIKIYNITYNINSVIHYGLDGSKEEITDLTRVRDFLLAKVDLSLVGDIGGYYKLYDFSDTIPVTHYHNSSHLVPTYDGTDEWNEMNGHEEWFAHQIGTDATQRENRIQRKYYLSYLFNPVDEWVQKYTDLTKAYLDAAPRYAGMFLDDTVGYVPTGLYISKRNEEQTIKEGIDQEGAPFKYIYTTYKPNEPVVVSNILDPNLTYNVFGVWKDMHLIFFDYNIPVAAGMKVNVNYYADATIPQEIIDARKQQMINMLAVTRQKIGGKLLLYNGFSTSFIYDDEFLQYADGGMMEGIFHAGWEPINSNGTESAWKTQIDKLFDISHTKKKIFLAQSNAPVEPDTPVADVNRVAMFCFASFLLGKGEYGYFNFTFASKDYNKAIYFDYWETDIGTPLEKYHLRGTINNANIYEREFENVLVLVNPSESNGTLNLGTSYQTLNGTVVSSVTLEAKSGVVLRKKLTNTTTVQPTTTTTTSVAPTTTTSTSVSGGGGHGGGGGASTTSSTTSAATTSIITTTTIKPSITTTTVIQQCTYDTDCNDGQFCNGTERCVEGTCIGGSNPCRSEQVCKEANDQCRAVRKMSAKSIPSIINRPVLFDRKARWVLVKTEEDNHFEADKSSIKVIGPKEGAQGISVNKKRRAFKVKSQFGNFIALPLMVEKEMPQGPWKIMLQTEVEGNSPFDETIISEIQIK